MLLFETEERIKALRIRIRDRRAAADSVELIELAWYLRQSDQKRSEELVRQARRVALLASLQERVTLLSAEQNWLAGHADNAFAAAAAAHAQFVMLRDPIGCADAKLLQAAIAKSTHRVGELDKLLVEAADYAKQAGDLDRAIVIRCAQIRENVYVNPTECLAELTQEIEPLEPSLHLGTMAQVAFAKAAVTFRAGDTADCVHLFASAMEKLQATGQTLLSIICASNISAIYNLLHDSEGGLEWAQRALEASRKVGWPLQLGIGLIRVALCMRSSGRPEVAEELLDEAQPLLEKFRGSRDHGLLLLELGATAVAREQPERALVHYRELATIAHGATSPSVANLRNLADVGIANSLLKLGRLDEAETVARTALAEEHSAGISVHEPDMLQLLGEILMARRDFAGAITHFEHALRLASTITNFSITSALYAQLGEALRETQQFEAAYGAACQSREVAERQRSAEIASRTSALKLRLSLEKLENEVERQRQRSDLLAQSAVTLQQLGAIGQEITAQLNLASVFETIQRHVNTLLPAECFTIYLVEKNGLGLVSIFDIEDGVVQPEFRIDMSDPYSHTVRCLRERRELLLSFSAEESDSFHMPGTLLTRSGLFSPLVANNRVLGVMSIQSTLPDAYGDREQMIFRTLCAYAAIALDNALAYTHLQEVQEQLAAQEKMAALGSLVAGVAHELNTPIGNCLLGVTTLQARNAELIADFEAEALRRSSIKGYIEDVVRGTDLILRNLQAAAHLVESFKQVAVNRTTERRESFDLAATSHEVLSRMADVIEAAGHRMSIDIPSGIVIEGYPRSFGEVLTAFATNAIHHGFAGRSGGEMRLSASIGLDGEVEVAFADNGCGIHADHINRIFDPFFTTRLGHGSNGLGLSICRNIATMLYGGTLDVESAVGVGTTFRWRFPTMVPTPSD